MENSGLERVYNRLEPLLKKGQDEGVFSGAAAGVYSYDKGKSKRLILTQGMTHNEEHRKTIDSNTYFDLASLTKPICTTLAILCLIEAQQLDFESKVFEILSFKIKGEYKQITVDQLLTHSGGLIAYKPVYKNFPPEIREQNTNEIVLSLLQENLIYQPGSACVYSDIGFILLGLVIEKLTGTSLDVFFKDKIAAAFRITDTVFFRKIKDSSNGNENIAATEYCPWRQKLLQGEVHDEHAWLMNGVAGHAGLFATIDGVLCLAEQLLHCWKGRVNHPEISHQLLQQALSRKYTNQTWCRGFDTPSPRGSSAGVYFSPESVGHLGFTGTSFWIDPAREVIIVLLSNRIHPSRINESIKLFRPCFHNAAMEVLYA